ncbi:MAG: hypothetical protein P8X65_10705 [Syntrophobacterales bacterium]
MVPTPPAMFAGHRFKVSDSLIAEGCVLEDAKVVNSVLSPGVKVGAGAEVEAAILWDKVSLGAGAKIRRAVIEDGVTVPPGFTIGYDSEADAQHFTLTEEGVVVVPNNVRLEVD